MKKETHIRPLAPERTDDFFVYLNDHISDNGKDNSPLFLPISSNDLSIPRELVESFTQGQLVPIDTLGWRRVFIAVTNQGEIIGHIDLKSHPQAYTHHRAILGMGVHRDYRKMGIGSLLIEAVMEWAKQPPTIECIDLWVLAENSPAIRLYTKWGFEKVGRVEDMFRIDGASHAYIMMTSHLKMANPQNNSLRQ